ncbi:cupin domain-containing protein (plasmid) [Ensifer sp. D2-11]
MTDAGGSVAEDGLSETGSAEDSCSAALEYLLAPISLTGFFEDVYEKTFLHVCGRTNNYFTHIFSREAAEIVLWQQESRIPSFVRLHNNGTEIAAPRSSSPLDFSKWAFDAYSTGASIIINNLEDFHLPLASFVRELEELFSSRVSASAYLTPQQARAFRVHFDTHDVLILQVEGTKHYRLFKNANSPHLPIKRQFYPISHEEIGEPSDSITLKPGDLLYIPRGLVHAAHTDESHSLHLSIGLHPPKLADIISTCVELAAEQNGSLRESLDISDTRVASLVERLANLLGAELTIEALLARQRLRFAGSLRALPGRQLFRAELAERLRLDDWVQRTPGAVISAAIIEGTLQFNFPGLGVIRDESILPNRVEAPAILEPIIRFIGRRRTAFQVSELPKLSDDAKLVLVRSLVRQGLLQESSVAASNT